MQGIDLPPGGLARRALRDNGEMPEELVKAIQRQATLRALSETPANTLNDPNRLLSQIGPMLANMPDDMAANTAFGVANRYVRMGQWSMAREVFLLLVERYPAHPLAMESYRWLIRHNSSTEARHRHELGQFLVVEDEQHGVPIKSGSTPRQARRAGRRPTGHQDAGLESGHDADTERQAGPSAGGGLTTTKRDKQKYLFAPKEQIRQWYQSSLALEPRLAGFGPLLTSDPSLQFCLQAARRSLGDFQTRAEVVLAFRVAPAGRTLALRRAGGVVADQPQRRTAQAGVDLSVYRDAAAARRQTQRHLLAVQTEQAPECRGRNREGLRQRRCISRTITSSSISP